MLLEIPIQRLNFIAGLKDSYKVFLLSNTNEIHMYKFDDDLRKRKYRCIKFCPVVQLGIIFKTEEDLQV